MTFQFHYRCKLHDVSLHLRRRINSINCDSGADNIQICFRHTYDARTVRAVMQRNIHSGFLYTFRKILISFKLNHRRASVILIRSRKVSKHPLYLKIRKFSDLFDFLHTLWYIRITNSGHTCIQRNMNMYRLIL